MICHLALIVVILAMPIRASVPETEESGIFTDAPVESLQTLNDFLQRHPPGMYAREIVDRKRARRLVQQHGYATMLSGMVSQDGFGALLTYLRMCLQLEFSLPHNIVFWIRLPDPEHGIAGIPFEEDWKFPADPWRRH